MRDLVKQRVINIFLSNFCRLLASRDVRVIVSNAANIFHGTHIVVRTKDLIEFTKWICCRENFFKVVDSVFSNSKPVLSHFRYKFLQRLSAKNSHRNFLISILLAGIKLVIRTGTNAVKIGTNWSRFIKLDLV